MVETLNEKRANEVTSPVIAVCTVYTNETIITAHSINMLVNDINEFINLITRWPFTMPE